MNSNPPSADQTNAVFASSIADFARSHGISRAQGYLLGEPLPAAEMTPLLRRHLVPGPPPRRGRRTDTGRV